MHCPCGSEWIGAVDPTADDLSPVICANCGKAAYIDMSVLPLYVRGVVLTGPSVEPGKGDGDAMGVPDDDADPGSTEADRGIAGIATDGASDSP
jgi:hypothetical protein